MEYLNSFYDADLADRVMDGVASSVKLTNGELDPCFRGVGGTSARADVV